MNDNPTVSVIIPTYNHRNFILETFESVFAQTFTDFEVIVVNDGSPDDTAQVLHGLRVAGRILYLEQPNGGQASARNFGLQNAKGDFVAFLDDDDLWPPGKLEWQVAFLTKVDAVLVGGAVAAFDTGNPPRQEFDPGSGVWTLDKLAEGNPFWSPGQTLIRHSALLKIGAFDTSIWGADDLDLYLRLARIGDFGATRGPAFISVSMRQTHRRIIRKC